MSKFEDIVTALLVRLNTIEGPEIGRNDPVPEKVPKVGQVILHDGRPEESERILGMNGVTQHRHEFEIEIRVQRLKLSERNALFDELVSKVGVALDGDKFLGGLIDGMDVERPDPFEEHQEGAAPFKAGFIPLFIEYVSEKPLA